MKPQVLTLILDESICPLSTFKKLREHQSQSFFFESADAIGEMASITIIGLGAIEPVVGPVFAALSGMKMEKSESEIPYANGGFFGCIGYDSIVQLEPKLKFTGNLAKRSKETDKVFFASDLIVFEHKRKCVHFIGAAREYQSFLSPCMKTEVDAGEVAAERLIPNLGPQKYFAGVRKLKEHIRSGDIFQAVLAERFECLTDAKSIDIFSALRVISPTPYSFFFSLGKVDFFGASPETLLKVDGSQIRTHPIAGTRPRGKTKSEDLLRKRQLERSPKEASEHLMLVDLARNDIGRVARAGTVNVNFYRTVKKFSNVMHLVSEVEAELAPDYSIMDAFGACFPAGTLSGAPKFRAIELIAGLEETPRGFYGGAVMAFDPAAQRLDTCIAIRSLEMQNGKAILRAGAGIVADSKAEFEYEEIKHKLKPLRQAIASAERN